MKRVRALAVVLLVAISSAACSAASSPEATADLEVFVPYRGVEADRFKASLGSFEQASGVQVRVIGSADFATELRRRVNDAQPPDIAVIPQPGVLAELASIGAITRPVDPAVADAVDEFVTPGARQLGTYDGELIGVPYRLNPKSLVWYSPELFAEMGWAVPASLEEMYQLTLEIAESDIAPWCFGIEAQGATGWVATDWIEEILLRQAGPEVYDEWVAGDIDFTGDELVATFEYLQALLLERGHVLGDASGIVRTRVDDAVLPLLDDPPGCAMHRNAPFTASWLPDGTVLGPGGDLDVFVLPPFGADDDPPMLMSVDIAAAMTEDPAAQDLLAYLASPSGAAEWTSAGGFIGAHGELDQYGTAFDGRIAAHLDDGTILRVDGSDQMIPEFGSGTFWEIAAQWVGGTVPTPRALQLLDDARLVAADAAG